MRVAAFRANVTAQQLVVCVCVFTERNASCEKETNQKKKKIFRVYVLEKRTGRSTTNFLQKSCALG